MAKRSLQGATRSLLPESPKADRSGRVRFPVEKPELPPTARRILEATRRLLVKSGYSALSLSAISREAGETRSLIAYYFGNKAGLMVALSDWLLYDILRDLQTRVAQQANHENRFQVAVRETHRLAEEESAYYMFYTLLPHLLKSKKARERLALLYSAYRDFNARAFFGDTVGTESPDVRALAAIHVAFTDGIAMQLMIDPSAVDMDRIARLWETFARVVQAGPQE